MSERALVQRINRKLRQDDEVMKATRGERAHNDLGRFYVLDYNRNLIVAHHCDPEAVGRELGVLRDREHVVIG